VVQSRQQLMDELRQHSCLVLVGETGSGKTTQIPQFIYKDGLTEGGRGVACTQPRRVAAISVAQRVAEEMGTEVGGLVGYSVRFEDKSSSATRIKYLTDGMLVREVLRDPLLLRYSAVCVDEAHERTVATDVLFGLLKGVLAKRPSDFRLIVMSATLDTASFVSYFEGARAVYIHGRQFLVQVMYTPEPEDDYLDAALTTVMQIHLDHELGDVLVFLTGQEEIESMERLLGARAEGLPADAASILVAPIYAAMPREQQMRVFDPTPAGSRKVVLATNIAETSLTIPGIRYVVDTGFVKSRNYSAKLGADSLQVVPISQAQARQRSGRAGREAPGTAFRLYTEPAFQGLKARTAPEIQRMNLSSVVLQLKALGVDDIVGFDFMDPPPQAALLRALELLLALGALRASDGSLSELGKRMARLPVDPMFAKVLLMSGEMGCCREALGVVAMVSTDNVFFTPRGRADEAAEARKRFVCPSGDHATLLQVFRGWSEVPRNERHRWCHEHFVNSRAMTKADDIHKQLLQYVSDMGVALSSCGEDTAVLRRCLASGLFPNAARAQPDGSYALITSGQRLHLHPSSSLTGSGHVRQRSRPPCVVFNELVRTTRQYGRCVSAVEPAWLLELAPQFFAAKGDLRSAVDGAVVPN